MARPRVAAGILVTATLLAFIPAMRAGFIWDDESYVTNNPTLRSGDGLRRIWLEPSALPQYYPLVHTMFWVECRLWGFHPLGYHVINVCLHALNAVLLWILLRRLSVPGAWLAAAIFALHPVHVESVAWITERKNVLSGVFYFWAALLFCRFFLPGERTSDSHAPSTGWGPWRYYAIGSGLYLCALFSKTVTCTLPAAMLLLIWWKRGRISRRDILALAPLMVVGAGLGWTTAWLEEHRVGAQGPDWSLSVVQRCLVAGRALWFYAGKLIWPHPLTFIYPRWKIDEGVWWQYLFPVAAMVGVVVLWALRRRIGRGPLTAVLFFAGTLVPALGFFNVYPMRFSYVADHFQYLASIGVIALFTAACTFVFKRLGAWEVRLGRLLTVVVPTVLGVLTWKQGHVYKDVETLWRDTLAKNPECFLAHGNLGTILWAQGRTDEAIAHFTEALRIKPDYGEAHYNLGAALDAQGKLDEAVVHYKEAVRLASDFTKIHNRWRHASGKAGDTEGALAHFYLGLTAIRQGRPELAIAQFKEALRIDPSFAEAHHGLGRALAAQGLVDQAVAQYEEALRINPNLADAHNSLGTILAGQGKMDQAIAHYREAVRIRPNEVEGHYNLGGAFHRQNQLDQAMAEYEQTLRIQPDHADAHHRLGMVLAAKGRTDQAIVHYKQAVRIRPDHVQAHYNLAEALSRRGQPDSAKAEYEETLRLDPTYAKAHNNLGILLAAQGKIDQAIAHWVEAARIKPDYVEAHYNLGVALDMQGKFDQAIARYEEVLRLAPGDAVAHKNLGLNLVRCGRTSEGIAHFRKACELRPDWPEPLNNLARLLATSRDDGIRNGAEAVRLATRCCELTRYEQPEALDTLAAAHAEAGQFDQAVKMVQKGIDLALRSGNQELLRQMRERLRLYQSSQPFRDSGR